MTTSLGLLSFRKNVTRIVKDTAANDDDDDDDDEGWVHGGKYVPAAASAKQQWSQPQPASSSTPPATASAINAGGISAGANKGNGAATTHPSPYSMLSPPPLNTPLPLESMMNSLSGEPSANATTSQQQQQRGRTPMTIQLQRLLQPTPSPHYASTPATTTGDATTTYRGATPPNNAATTTPPIVSTPLPQPKLLTAAPTQPPPATPVGKFLLQSGVPTTTSHTIGVAASRLTSIILGMIMTTWNGIIPWWNTMHSFMMNHLPTELIPDIVESILEFVGQVCTFVWNVLIFVTPYVLWMMQTLIALALTIAGTILWGLVALAKRSREAANRSSVGNVQLSALKSLRENVRNSPFRKSGGGGGGRLPFMGFSGAAVSPFVNGGNNDGQQHQQQRVYQLVSNQNMGQGHQRQHQLQQQPATTTTNDTARFTPPINSAIRTTSRSSSLKQTPNYAASNMRNTNQKAAATVAAPTPATATRRVLFSETEHGEVSTEQFHFDKHLPASARKVDHRRMDQRRSLDGTPPPARREGGQKVSSTTTTTFASAATAADSLPSSATTNFGTSDAASMSASTASMATTPDNTILRPSKYFEHASDNTNAEDEEKLSQPGRPKVAARAGATSTTTLPKAAAKASQQSQTSNTNTINRKEQVVSKEEEEEQKKQQYINRYGLLPTITPLSKRYGRMKRQQQQQKKTVTDGHSNTSNTADTATSNKTGLKNNNAKRKRRGDLLGAASRLGRTRRARLGTRSTVHSSLPSVLLHRTTTPMKRRRDDGNELSRTDEWVWKAMNGDNNSNSEKENRVNDLGGATKRGKFNNASGVFDATNVVNNANKSNVEVVVGTPPKNNATVMTPPKTPGPSGNKFSVPLGSATPAPKRGNGVGAGGGTPGKPSIPTFAFGGADDTAGGVAAAGGAFSFGKTNDGAAAVGAAADSSGSASGTSGFSFGTTTTEALEKRGAAASSSTAAAAAAPGFSFNASSANATAPAGNEKNDAAPAFAFGNNSGSVSAPKPAEGNAPVADPAVVAAAASFSFGATTDAGVAGGTTAPAQTTPAQFGFGASSQPAPAANAAAGAQITQPAPSAGAGFSFGTAPSTTAAGSGGKMAAPTAPAAAPSTAAFGFGAPSQPVAAGAATAQAQPSTFSFGTGAPGTAPAAATSAAAPTTAASFAFGGAPSQAAPAGAAPVQPQPSSFSFGTGAAAAGAAPPNFGATPTAPPAPPAFGATPAANAFSLGGSTTGGGGGASARRRARAAKSGGRRR